LILDFPIRIARSTWNGNHESQIMNHEWAEGPTSRLAAAQ
jgi:hypothetical protein